MFRCEATRAYNSFHYNLITSLPNSLDCRQEESDPGGRKELGFINPSLPGAAPRLTARGCVLGGAREGGQEKGICKRGRSAGRAKLKMISAPFIPSLQPKEIWKQRTFVFPMHPEMYKCTDVCEAIHPFHAISILFNILNYFFSLNVEEMKHSRTISKRQTNLHLQDQHQSLELLVHSRAVIFKEKKKSREASQTVFAWEHTWFIF